MPVSARSPEVVWRPDPGRVATSRMTGFRHWLRERDRVDAADYDALWRWSVTHPGPFWAALADFFAVTFHDRPTSPLDDAGMPGTRWFPGATVNYAEHALRAGNGRSDDDEAVVFRREDGLRRVLRHGQLRREVAAAAAGLVELGVRRGDRVAAMLPNGPEALVAFLATASLGAVWSSCSPELGAHAAAERFGQIDPAVLIAADGYRYRGREVAVSATIEQLRRRLPNLHATVVVPDLRPSGPGGERLDWGQLLARHDGARLAFEPVPFEHPLWVLYSSGTTGPPKGIVHGHGGILLEHLKSWGLHFDAGPGDRLFWYTTTGWMMWNFLVSGLLTESVVVLYDGAPDHPDPGALWRMAAQERLTVLGTSAPFVHACQRDGLALEPADYPALRVLGSTGAPLAPDGFAWLGANLGPGVQIASFSGGTDVCTGFLGPAPDVPVWLGELSRPALGAAVAAFDEHGHAVVDQVGELVLTVPLPSMPVSFWNDPDGSRLREAYFADFPGAWRHGDWVTITSRGSAVIHGRSDATIKRAGVRMGTAEFYRVLEAQPGVLDALVVQTPGSGATDGQLLCFVVLDQVELDTVEPHLRQVLRTQLSPRHVPDRFWRVAAVPRTLNGKKCEVPVTRILAGADPDAAVSRQALANPDALDTFVQLARQRSPGRLDPTRRCEPAPPISGEDP